MLPIYHQVIRVMKRYNGLSLSDWTIVKVHMIQVWRGRRQNIPVPKSWKMKKKLAVTPHSNGNVRCCSIQLKYKDVISEMLFHIEAYCSQHITEMSFWINLHAMLNKNKDWLQWFRKFIPNHILCRLWLVKNCFRSKRSIVWTFS